MTEQVAVVSPAVRRFLAALELLEMHRDLDLILECFADDSELTRLSRGVERGTDGARRFWKGYRDTFGDLSSRFVAVNDRGPVKVLEWLSEGTLPQGAPVRYAGVTLLETDDATHTIRRLRTYFDSSAILAHTATSEVPPEAGTKPYSEAV